MTYDAFRAFADSWGLAMMCVLFVGFIGWTFRPRAHIDHKAAATSIFRDEDANDG
jgi:cytochrome c oxidase cbb3-type subunit IV